MNYQKQNSQSDFSSIFGGNSGSSSANDGLQLSSEGSGVIYKNLVEMLTWSLTITLLPEIVPSMFYFLVGKS